MFVIQTIDLDAIRLAGNHISDLSTHLEENISPMGGRKLTEEYSINYAERTALQIVPEDLSLLQEEQRLLDENQEQVSSNRNVEEFKRQTLNRAKQIVAEKIRIHHVILEETVAKASKYQAQMGT